jgi:hypothetical protein
MDVQALDSVVTVLPPSGPAQLQNRTDNSNVPAATASAAAAPARASSSVSASQPVPTKPAASDTAPGASSIAATDHVAYKLVTSPVQTVIVFTNSRGVEVGQFPPQQLVALVKFDHDHASGSHVDQDV